MRKQKTYSLEILERLKIEIAKLKEKKRLELALDSILLQSKKDILDLFAASTDSTDNSSAKKIN